MQLIARADEAVRSLARSLARSRLGLWLFRVPRSRGHIGTEVELSVVIPTLDATSATIRRCIHSIRLTVQAPHEIIVVENGAPPQGFSAPANAGIRASRGRYVLVANDDLRCEPGWWQALRRSLDDGGRLACPRDPEQGGPAPWCIAMSRETLGRLVNPDGDLFDPHLVVWYQDDDLFARAREVFGHHAVVAVDAAVMKHVGSRTLRSRDPALRTWIDKQIAKDRERFREISSYAVLPPRTTVKWYGAIGNKSRFASQYVIGRLTALEIAAMMRRRAGV